MKIFFIIFSVFIISHAYACEPTDIIHENNLVNVCYTKKKERYLSPNCTSIEKCFLKKKFTFHYFPNQSPGFSLCYQIDGLPFFAEIPGKKDRVPMCYKEPYYVDQDNLFMTYMKEGQ